MIEIKTNKGATKVSMSGDIGTLTAEFAVSIKGVANSLWKASDDKDAMLDVLTYALKMFAEQIKDGTFFEDDNGEAEAEAEARVAAEPQTADDELKDKVEELLTELKKRGFDK